MAAHLPVVRRLILLVATYVWAAACSPAAGGNGAVDEADWLAVDAWDATVRFTVALEQESETDRSSMRRTKEQIVVGSGVRVGDRYVSSSREAEWSFQGDGLTWTICAEAVSERQFDQRRSWERRASIQGSGESFGELWLELDLEENSYRLQFFAGPLEGVRVVTERYQNDQLTDRDSYTGECETGHWTADGSLPAEGRVLSGSRTWDERDAATTLTWELRPVDG